jgi:hypothetical protein
MPKLTFLPITHISDILKLTFLTTTHSTALKQAFMRTVTHAERERERERGEEREKEREERGREREREIERERERDRERERERERGRTVKPRSESQLKANPWIFRTDNSSSNVGALVRLRSVRSLGWQVKLIYLRSVEQSNKSCQIGRYRTYLNYFLPYM